MRVVFGSNTLISAILFEENESEIYSLANENKFQLVLSPEIIEETKRVLNEKFQYPKINEFVKQLSQLSKFSKENKEHHVMDKIDYKDNIITDCAINGNVDFIISRDKHLLGLREVNHKGKSIKILRTKEFLKILKRQF